jgi:hypothetical protein
MAYPEPTPELKGRDAKEFIQRLEAFDITDEQLELYKDSRDFYQKMKAKECAGK